MIGRHPEILISKLSAGIFKKFTMWGGCSHLLFPDVYSLEREFHHPWVFSDEPVYPKFQKCLFLIIYFGLVEFQQNRKPASHPTSSFFFWANLLHEVHSSILLYFRYSTMFHNDQAKIRPRTLRYSHIHVQLYTGIYITFYRLF